MFRRPYVTLLTELEAVPLPKFINVSRLWRLDLRWLRRGFARCAAKFCIQSLIALR